MHIKLLYRKVLYVFLSLMIVVSTTQSAFAASPAGWTVSHADIIIGAAGNTVTAIKGAGASALQSTVKYAPTVANIGKNILKGGGAAAVTYAVYQIAGKAVDYVLDPANNRVIYYDDPPQAGYLWRNSSYKQMKYSEIPTDACNVALAQTGITKCVFQSIQVKGDTKVEAHFYYSASSSGYTYYDYYRVSVIPNYQPEPKYIPISTVAAKVQSNAVGGHAPSQDLIKTVIIDDVNAGAVDVPLNTNAVPVADAPPVNPPSTDPNNPQAPAFDPSSIIAAIKSVMAAVVNMSGILGAKIDALMVDLGLKHEEKLAADAANTAEIVAANDRTGAQVAAISAAIADIEGNTLDGKVINDAIDRAIAAGNTNTSDIVAAIEAIEGNTLDGQVINDAVDKVIANDDANAKAANDVVSDSVDKAIEAGQADATKVADAVDAQTDAITTTDPTTGEKTLKLPAFCGFAPVVCDYIDWVKGEYQTMSDFVKAEPETMPDEPVVVADDPSGLGDVFRDKAEAGYVSFASQCPDNVLIPVSLMGASQTLNISYAGFCHFASLIRPAVILGAWISGLLIISGGRARE